MARNGSGTYSAVSVPVVTGTTISNTAFNATIADLATALTGSLAANGETTPTANIKLGGYKITGLGAPTVSGDALSQGGPIAGTTGTFSGAVVSAGVTDGSSAASGKVGEVISSVVVAASGIALTTSTQTNITSITVPAGDWDIWGNVQIIGAGTTTTITNAGSISVTSATLDHAVGHFSVAIPPSAYFSIVSEVTLQLSGFPVSQAGSVTYYLVGYSEFSVSTAKAAGAIYARRVR